MIQQVQDTNTNITVGGYRFPDGTIFTAFVNIGAPTANNLSVLLSWRVNGGTDVISSEQLPIELNNLPVRNAEGNLLYTFTPYEIVNDPFNTALKNLSYILRDFLRDTNANLYNCQVIDIP